MPLGSGIVENAWYQLNLRVDARGLSIACRWARWCSGHTDPSNPFSGLAGQIGSIPEFEGSLDAVGLEHEGFVRMAAWADLARVNTSMTNFFAATGCIS